MNETGYQPSEEGINESNNKIADPEKDLIMAEAKRPYLEEISKLTELLSETSYLKKIFQKKKIEETNNKINLMYKLADERSEEARIAYEEDEAIAWEKMTEEQASIDELYSEKTTIKFLPNPDNSPKGRKKWKEIEDHIENEIKKAEQILEDATNELKKASQENENFYDKIILFDSNRNTSKEIALNASMETIAAIMRQLGIERKSDIIPDIQHYNDETSFRCGKTLEESNGHSRIGLEYYKKKDGSTTVALNMSNEKK